jgi:hypothetical protein
VELRQHRTATQGPRRNGPIIGKAASLTETPFCAPGYTVGHAVIEPGFSGLRPSGIKVVSVPFQVERRCRCGNGGHQARTA